MSVTLNLFVVTVACCVLTLCMGFPRAARQSFFRCSGWGAGCTNMDYSQTADEDTSDASDSREKDEGGQKLSYSMPYLFTSGRSWGAIGKRWGPASWHSDPYLRRILLPYMLSANNNVWVRHYFPDEYLAFKQQFGRSASVQASKQKRDAGAQ
ncbi:uncharacterized protein [Haliotis asinina]|uniref:uncharacterized protein n=1 Tax=Haliotis asinina TaxID=109174 RepID=UPI003531CAEC